MILNIVAEGSSEEAFVNDVMVRHFASSGIYISVRKILTGWDKVQSKPAKGGLLKYSQLKNDIIRWIRSDQGRKDTCYTSFVDLYAFPKDESPYTPSIQSIKNPYDKVAALEEAFKLDIGHPAFIPYVQLHEFETFILTSPDRMLTLYPDKRAKINQLKTEIAGMAPEEINEKPDGAPSKRIIKYIPEYKGQKAQVGPLVAGEIGITELREKCPHFNGWLVQLEQTYQHSVSKK